jgi:nicotinamidase-related amidase
MSEPVVQDPAAEAPWLVVVDPQVIFADPASEWASPEFDDAMAVIERIAPASWAGYFEQWTFADRPASDPLYDLVPRARALTDRPTVDEPTFGKWGDGLRAVVGEAPHLVLAGVSTDCCVITTALAAADAGAHVQILTDGCAGSTAEDGAAALRIMGLFDPQIRLVDSTALI